MHSSNAVALVNVVVVVVVLFDGIIEVVDEVYSIKISWDLVKIIF